jgi:hypothetical protein
MTSENLAPCPASPRARREVSKAIPSPHGYFAPEQELFGCCWVVVPLPPLHDPFPPHDPAPQLLLQPAARTRPPATLTTDTAARTLRILVFFIEPSMMADYP